MNRTNSLESSEYTPVAQADPQQLQNDPPPAYEHPPQIFAQGVELDVLGENNATRSFLVNRGNQESLTMPDLESCFSPTRGNLICKLISAAVVVAVAIVVACMVDSYHKINEGNVGIYFRHGAIRDKVTEPGVHFLMPFIEDYKEVKIRPETYSMAPVLSITKDGIENTFKEITAITTVRKDKIVLMAKKIWNGFQENFGI